MCEILGNRRDDEDKSRHTNLKLQRIRALCDAIHSSQSELNNEELQLSPNFDVTRIHSDEDINNLLQRFRRASLFVRYNVPSSSKSSSRPSARTTTWSSSISRDSKFRGGNKFNLTDNFQKIVLSDKVTTTSKTIISGNADKMAGNDNGDDNNFLYPTDTDDSSAKIDDQIPTVFYCHQKNFHLTLIPGTLNDEGIGKCNIANRIVTCPIEIQCEISEADDCCEDEDGTPFCCGHYVPKTTISYFPSGTHRTHSDRAMRIGTIVTVVIFIGIFLAVFCFAIWHQ
ncbi:unnamed protein product [Rotaria sordida]|uniref:Uncharacterized protein n=1 Tax=Rotaria sordida TaxID=392033 RepID=A0A815BTG3_9BILA|nr:unnamed protein product [Rotaria sordida]CAF1273901.1 unnamed protein product [Rotaria sordida]CAF1318167.1 unnamed protein product [Rotaria sordida]